MRTSECSVSKNCSSDSEEEIENCDEGHNNALVLQGQGEDLVPTFGNVSVTNSSEVHFGNKTIYKAPVTIKQFLYTNGSVEGPKEIFEAAGVKLQLKGFDNQGFVGDGLCPAPKKELPEEQKGIECLEKVKKRKFIILIFLVVLMLLLGLLLIGLLWKHGKQTSYHTDTDEQEIIEPIGHDKDAVTLSDALRMVTRAQWVAQPPINETTPLVTPVPYVIIMHTATENCSYESECVLHVRLIQQFHIESQGFYDIGYNFLVGGDGSAYEGRGWKIEGAHTRGYNAKSIGIAFVGTFITIKPPKRQIVACNKLIERGVELGYIRKDYKLLAARQLYTTESPGKLLYEDVKTWPHWSSKP